MKILIKLIDKLIDLFKLESTKQMEKDREIDLSGLQAFEKEELARQGKYLDKFVSDENFWVRIQVAKQNYNLDKLKSDENELVRLTVAQRGYDIDTLIKDSSKIVREAALKNKI